MTLEDLIKQVTSYRPNADLDLINQPCFASGPMKDKSGSLLKIIFIPYLRVYFVVTAMFIYYWGLLHDVVEAHTTLKN